MLFVSDDVFFSSQWCQWQVNLVLQVSLALRDQLVPLAHPETVPKVCLDPKDLLDPPVLLDAPSLASPDPQVDLANQAFLEHMVRRETPEPLVFRDQGEPLDLLEALDPLASLLLASLGLLVFPELWDLEESLDIKDTQVFLDCQVLRVIEGWELLDLRVRQDLKGLWDQLEHLVHLELESQENQVQLVSQESQVAQVEMVPLVLWDQWDPRATLVPLVLVFQVNQVTMAPQVFLVQWALKVTKDLLELPVPLESLDMENQVQMERREREELQEARVLQVQRVSKVQQVILELLVQLAPLVLLDLRVSEVSLEDLVLLALKVTQGPLVLRGLRETREIRDHRDS